MAKPKPKPKPKIAPVEKNEVIVSSENSQDKGYANTNILGGGTRIRNSPKAQFTRPYNTNVRTYGNVKVLDQSYRFLNYRVLRDVATKCWVINACIDNATNKIKPFITLSNDENTRGFVIKEKGKTLDRDSTKATEVFDFLYNTGSVKMAARKDKLPDFAEKILRDVLTLDQVATEIQYTMSGRAVAFYAIDAGTIERAVPFEKQVDNIEYVQQIDNIATAFFEEKNLIFACMTPRTDIRYAGYGFSKTEQAIDLVTATINTFAYNAGYFNENRLPRGALLLQGDADLEEVEAMTDYMMNMMMGPAQNQWRIPVIPSGGTGEKDKKLEWVDFGQKHNEMGFEKWYDLCLSSIAALYGMTLEDLGIKNARSGAMIGDNVTPYIEASKSQILGTLLTFLQRYLNRILALAFDDIEIEFVGYEKADPKLQADLDQKSVTTYKTPNELRADKGMERLDHWAYDQIQNATVLQIMAGEKQQEGMGGDMGGFGDDNDNDLDDETGSQSEQEPTNEPDYETMDDLENNDGMEKSLNGVHKHGETYVYRSEEDMAIRHNAMMDAINYNTYDFVCNYLGIPKTDVVIEKAIKDDDVMNKAVLRHRFRVVYNPQTGNPLTPKEWKAFVEALEAYLSKQLNGKGEKIILDAKTLGTLISKMQKNNKSEYVRTLALSKLKYKRKSYDWLSEDVKNLTYITGEDMSVTDKLRYQLAQTSCAERVTAVGDRVKDNIKNIILDGITHKDNKGQVSQNLFNKLHALNKDFYRIVDYEGSSYTNLAYILEEANDKQEGEKVYFKRVEIADQYTCKNCLKFNGRIVLWSDIPLDEGKYKETLADGAVVDGVMWEGKEQKFNAPVMSTSNFHPYCRGAWERYYDV